MHAPLDQPRRARKARRPGATVIVRDVMGAAIGAPIVLDRRRRSLAAIAARHADATRPFVLSVHPAGSPALAPDDATVVMRRDWSSTRVAAGDTVLITCLPLGGGGGGGSQSQGKQIGAAVAMIALMAVATVVAPGIGNALVAGATGGLLTTASAGTIAAVQAGLVIGGSYVLSLATKSAANDTSDGDTRPVYGVSGGGNLPRPGDRIPVGYGQFWTVPDLSQPDYSYYDGEDVVLCKRMTLGLGAYAVERIEIGAASRAVFWTAADGIQAPFDTADTAVEIIAPGDTSALVPGSVYSNANVSGLELPRAADNPSWAGPYATCPVGEVSRYVQIDWEHPRGLVNNGGSEPMAANGSVLYEIAPADDDDAPTGPWTTLYYKGQTTKTLRALRYSPIIDLTTLGLPVARYIVRARNTQAYVETVVNDATWSGLRTHFAESIVRPHVTEIAMKIRSGKQLGVTAFGEVYVRATRILPVWDSLTETWSDQPTRKAVWAFRDVLTAAYGGNIDPAQVDDATITHYADTLTEYDTFDGVIRGPVSVWEAAAVVLGPMRAEPAVQGSLWSLVRDEPKAVRRHVFTRRQIKKDTSAAEVRIAADDGSADIVVEYSPDGDPRRTNEARVTYGAASLTPKRVRLEGVTSWQHANHVARWMAASGYYRRWQRKFSVDRMGRMVGRGDPVTADVWFLSGAARTGGVLAASGLTLTLDTPMDQGGTLHAYLRDRRGREWGPVAVTIPDAEAPHVIALDADDVAAVAAFYGQTLAEVLAGDDEDPTTVYVGTLAELQRPYLVRSVRHAGRDAIEIEVREDSPEVWTAIGAAMPAEPVIPSVGDIAPPPYPTVAWVRARAVTKGSALAMEWALGAARGAASYVVRLSYDAGATWEIVHEGLSTDGSVQIRHEADATLQVQAWAIAASGLPGPVVSTTFTTYAETVPALSLQDSVRAAIADIRARIAAIDAQVAEAVLHSSLRTWTDKKTMRRELRAQTGALSASITEVGTVATDASLAVAALETSVTASLGEIEASVTEVSGAVADIDGRLASTWSVTTDVNGRMQSLRLYDDGTEGGIAFTVDTFTIALGSDGPADAVPAFIAALDGSTPTFAFNGVLKANAVKTANIQASAVVTDKIAIGGVDLLNIVNGAVTGSVVTTTSVQTFTIAGIGGGGVIHYYGSQSVTIGGGALNIRVGDDVLVDIAFRGDASVFYFIPAEWFFYIDIVVGTTTVKTFTVAKTEGTASDYYYTQQYMFPWNLSGLSVGLTNIYAKARMPAQITGTSITLDIRDVLVRVQERRR